MEETTFPSIESDDVPTEPEKGKKMKKGFQAMGLSKQIFGALMRIGFRVPTPIQKRAIPVALSGGDVVAMARTGSGKTAAFVIPILERLKTHSMTTGIRGLILAPTRELAIQSLKFTVKLAKFTDLRCALIVGGESLNAQFSALASNPDIIVATPGRLCHLMKEIKDFSLARTEFIVLDEADRLFEMGFAEQIDEIFTAIRSENRQTMLVSATMPKVLAEFTHAGLKDPTFVRLDADTKISPTLRIGFLQVRKAEKPAALIHLIREVIPAKEQTIIFTATRHHVQFLLLLLRDMGMKVQGVFGNMDMTARKRAVSMFRKRTTRFLIVTDVAARGLDIPLLKNVVNYDFPAKCKLFVHRAGRAGRQGRVGTVLSLVDPSEMAYMVDLFLFLGRPLRGLIENHEEDEDDDEDDDDRRTYTLKTMTTNDVDYGTIPRRHMDTSMETFLALKSSNHDLSEQYRVSNNAYKAYTKSRPPASRLSFLRAKELDTRSSHPLFESESNKKVENTDALSKISSYRPRSTIIEVSRLKSGKGPSLVMKEKRKRHRVREEEEEKKMKEIAAKKRKVQEEGDDDKEEKHEHVMKKSSLLNNTTTTTTKRRLSKAERRKLRKGGSASTKISTTTTNQKPTSFRDEKFYIATGPSSREDAIGESAMTVSGIVFDQGRRDIDQATMDIMGDETDRMKRDKQRGILWDTKRGRYIKTSQAELRKSRALSKQHKKDRAMGRVTQKKEFGKHYERWSKRSRRRVGAVGLTEGAVGDQDLEAMKELVLPHTKRNANAAIANKNAQNELKSEYVLRKQREEKDKKKKKKKKQGGGKKKGGVMFGGGGGRRGGKKRRR